MNVGETGGGVRINTATTTVISAKYGCLQGIFCSASTTGTIQLQDNASAVLVGQFTAVAGQFYRIPLDCPNGLKVITTGTIDCVVIASAGGTL